MEQLNRIELRGNVGNVRPPLKEDGPHAVNFSVATNYVFKGRNNEAQIETTWHNIVAWNLKGMPDLTQLQVGTPVHIIGRMRQNRYTGADGVERYTFEVQASVVEILDEPLTMQASY